MTLRWPLTPHMLMSHVRLYSRIIVSNSHGNTKYVDTVIIFQKLKRSMTPRWPLTPHMLMSHVWLYPRIAVFKSHENTSVCRWYSMIVCGYSDFFFKISDQKVNAQMTPRWPLTPLLLRSHVQLYPRIIASNSLESTSKHVDTLTLVLKTLTKG